MDTQPPVQIPFTDLPEGTVTFLFTDIEGSTQLLQRLREDYATLLADQRRILREAFANWHGHEVDTQGDAFFVAFSRATQAVGAAVEAQRKLAEHAWPAGETVKVRMGIHTGEPWSGDEGYVGMDVHRAARIAHVAHGGQVLLSEAATALVRDELPTQVSLSDLGRHLLKDIHRPERICQLVIEGQPAQFPALKSLEMLPPESARTPRKLGECPYRGLFAFREADAPFYFGRETFIDSLEHSIRARKLVVVIVGSSGSGKSSALFAGLLPRLRRSGGYQFAIFRPGSQPFHALAGVLLPLLEPGLSETDHLAEIRKLAERLAKGEISLAQVAERILEKSQNTKQVVLVVDQFEEMYTLCLDAGLQKAFIDELLAAVEAVRAQKQAALVVLLTMRADFLGQALAHRPFADALQGNSFLMGSMTRQELHTAIEKPADMQGAAFEAGLVERILDEVGEKPGNLPLLEFTLTQLWEHQTDGWLTHASYEKMGSVEGALTAYADQVYNDLDAGEKERARRVLVQLVQPGEGTEDTRRIATRKELGEESWNLIQRLADRRLVVTGRDAAGHETAEVVHEALIQKWGQFQEWMKADRSFRSWQERLRGSLRQWQESNQDEGALLSGAPLVLAQTWLAERRDYITPIEAGYIEASAALRSRHQKERERRRQWTILGLASGLVVAAVLGVIAFIMNQQAGRSAAMAQSEAHTRATAEANAIAERQVAEQQARIATARELALAAFNNLDADPQRSLLLGLHSAEIWTAAGQPVPNDLQDTLHQAIQADRIILDWSAGGKDILYVGFNPMDDRPRLVTGNPETGQATLVDPETNQVLLTLPATLKTETGAAISQDGKFIALPGEGNAVGIWEIATGRELRKFLGHTDPIRGAAFDPTGRFLASYGLGEQIIWDIQSGRKLLEFPSEGNATAMMVFSPDGQYIARVTGQAIRIVKIPSGGELLSHEHGFDVVSFAFSPDGKRIIAGGRSNNPTVWDFQSGQVIYNVTSNAAKGCMAAQLEAAAFSPDGKLLALGPCILDAENGERLFTLLGHSQSISRLAFNVNGERLITASYDGTVKVWDLTASHEVLTLPQPPAVYGVTFNPDGKSLVTTGMDKNALVWEFPSGKLLYTLTGHSDIVNGAAFSPDGKLLATFSADRTVRLWDTSSGKVLRLLKGHTSDRSMAIPLLKGVMAGAFSPRCDLSGHGMGGCPLATVGFDGQLIVWDASTGQRLYTYQDPEGGLKSVAYSPDGTRLAVGNTGKDGRVGAATILDAASGQVLHSLPAFTGWVWGLSFDPGGTRLATVNFSDTGKVWDVSTGEMVVNLQGPQQIQNSLAVAFSPVSLAGGQAESLVATGTDQSVILWNATSGLPLLSLTGLVGPIFSVAFSPDGKYLAATGWDGFTRIYVVRSEDLLALARSRVIRSLTTEECRQYFHIETCPAEP